MHRAEHLRSVGIRRQRAERLTDASAESCIESRAVPYIKQAASIRPEFNPHIIII